ncbi:MAG: helix-turn-helix domain-containing protein [Actinomycetota bacterium]|nr:helix-turn-helix domain-containing protein [Actinomycetota bacterium]
MTTTFGEVIREHRTRLGWSQRTLARQAGVTAAYIALLEKGTRVPGDELWERLQRIFGLVGSAEFSGPGERPFGKAESPVLADVLSAARTLEFPLPLPEESDWFDAVPFTAVVGPLGSGKTTYVARWLSRVAGRTGRQIVWVQLKSTSGPDDVERQLLAQVSTEVPAPATIGASTAGLPAALVRYLEGSKRTPPILCFDDWDPRGGGAHNLVADLAAMLQRTPVVATTESAKSSIGPATIRPMPRPTESDWHLWCDKWRVPPSVRTDFLQRIHYNPLAATIYKGAVFFTSPPEPAGVEANWRSIVGRIPSDVVLPWNTVVRQCVDSVGNTGSGVIKLLASAPIPVPNSWLGDYASAAETSKLVEYHLARNVNWGGLDRLAVHQVFRQNLGLFGQQEFPWLKEAQPEPPLVDLLLNLEMFEDAARSISMLVEDVLPTSEAPARLVDWADSLPAEVAERFPMVLFGLVRALVLREQGGDLSRAKSTVERLLSLPLSEGERWQALNQGADVAIRALDYARALDYVEKAERLFKTSAGSFDAQALDVLKARIYWEQGEFQAAKAAVEVERSGAARVESARHASWQARADASLGDFASAVRAANRGIEISRRSRAPRPEAYNTVLLAEYELVRGNLSRARRLAERAAHMADTRGLTNLRAQALTVQAEGASAQGDPKDAHRLLDLATNEITKRGDDPWANAYRLVTEARLVRLQPRQWTQLWSLAQQLEDEALRLAARNQHHPVVGDLMVESAHCWTATGYSHEARRVLNDLEKRRVNWRTRWEARLLAVVCEPESSDETRYNAVAEMIQEARNVGAPYLAVSCAYLASTYRLVGGDEAMADRYGRWIADVADSRGWRVLASKGRALVPAAVIPPSASTEVAVRNEGETSVAAPRRVQQGARTDPELPLPDPFDD